MKGIYVSTVNSLPVLRAAEEAGRLSTLTVVTTDLFPELVEWIRAGKVAATVYQRPVNQGRLALQSLYQFLLHGTRPASRLRVVPHLVMRSNLDLFLERLPRRLRSGAAGRRGRARTGEARATTIRQAFRFRRFAARAIRAPRLTRRSTQRYTIFCDPQIPQIHADA